MNHLKLLLAAVALGMAGVAAWLVCEAITLHSKAGQQRELAALSEPSADLSYDQALRTQLDALKNNDEFDTGIATAFNFASPNNRRNYMTSPDSDESEMQRRFAVMLHSPHYRFLLNHSSAEFGPEFVAVDEARQLVTLLSADGEEVSMLFVLRRQSQAPYEGCWMTEGVEILYRRPPPQSHNGPFVEA